MQEKYHISYAKKNNEKIDSSSLNDENKATQFPSCDDDGNYAIHLAAQNGLIKQVQHLLDAGANPLQLNHHKENALSLAFKNNHPSIVLTIYRRCQVEKAADLATFFRYSVEEQDVIGLRVFAKKAGRVIIQQLLQQEFMPRSRNSLLQQAIVNNDAEMVDFLQDYDWDYSYQNKDGETALDLAKRINNSRILACLLTRINSWDFPASSFTSESLWNINTISLDNNNNSQDSSHSSWQLSSTEDLNSAVRINNFKSMNYRTFSEYILQYAFRDEELYTLGNISKEASDYFIESEKSTTWGKEFLRQLWADTKNVEATKNYLSLPHLNKSADQSVIKKPPCLSFCAVEINKKEYCFIATSVQEKNELHTSLLKVTNQLNNEERKNNDFQYILIGGSLGQFSGFFMDVMKDDFNSNKKCAEKYYTKAFTKLFLKYGYAMKILGVSNFHFYPHDMGPPTENNLLIDMKVKNQIIKINSNFGSKIIHSCLECQKNKATALNILKNAQEYGEQVRNNSRPRLQLSPLRNSIKNNLTFFENHLPPSQVNYSGSDSNLAKTAKKARLKHSS